ncbi:PREDICTED: alpha-1,3/1,6-mannosyltransferase ALG2 [Papilio xuthus]|uniref:Alpha-1,3/1,6-mannosyltransferase ALG2 n=1 Tax=Papilio xuthus TaxID=66420 RepID=A0A194Q5T3_PAPXU|nr:PREDICTED: alpha-1,3/1,6-mannosyltransferase ALG2 [Papilio xuthus]KPI98760.1 Alpha-1,3/1,6-mannosyltransferase ALG2 [Papilio xuthus]
MVKIIFLHPDLGIGGAERLVLDAALAFKSKGHEVAFYTNHHDPTHCFAETRNGTFPVTVVGDWIPRSIFGRFKAACAYVRMVYAAAYLAWYVIPVEEPTLIFCDLISLCIPFLKMARGPFRIVFYCHHPDKLLTSEGGFLKKIYRAPLNWLEELTTARADKVLVNSKYTARVYQDAFQNIKDMPDICYPSINTDYFNTTVPKPLKEVVPVGLDKFIFLSINRYERKKNLQLALKALEYLKHALSESDWNRVHLIMAGGFDPINLENMEHYIELTDLVAELDIEDKVTFMKSPSDAEKVSLLYHCKALIYTPSNEHFGIVPLEAMYYKKPVIAVNSGGPTETIVNDVTGFLCEPTSESFGRAMCKLIWAPELVDKLGEAGRKRFETKFSFDAFTDQLDGILTRERQIISEVRAIEYEQRKKK